MVETGTIWESYDEQGRGRGMRDTFWSASFILLIMKESYESFVSYQTYHSSKSINFFNSSYSLLAVSYS